MAVAVVALALVPALEALRTGVAGSAVHESHAVAQYRLIGRMEEILAEPFDALDDAAQAAGSPQIPSNYSDPLGASDRLVVFLSRYDGDDADADGDPFTGGDEGLLWLRVEIEDTAHAIQTLTAQ